jgi:hypothetical protein
MARCCRHSSTGEYALYSMTGIHRHDATWALHSPRVCMVQAYFGFWSIPDDFVNSEMMIAKAVAPMSV